MAPEIRETMQKGHEVSRGCFQGQKFSYGPPCPRSFSGRTLDLKHANGGKQANADSETDGAVNNEKLSVQVECCGRPVQENYYLWSAASPNFLKEIHSHSLSHPFDGSFYPANQGQYFPTHWFPQVPLQVLPQCYPPDYGFQDFQYFVVIDFEATCDKEKNPHPQEIIEFPSVLVNSRTGQLEDCFQIYVRPTHNQLLTEFCKELTGIQQGQVDDGVILSEALLMHDRWLEDKGIKHTNFAIVTWSNWDCRVMLESECRFKRIRKPPYFNRWINLKIPFCEVFGGARCNLREAVELAGLTWEGRAHCGLDDAKNTARLLAHLMHRGFKFSITNTIVWQSADHPHVIQQQRIPTPEYGFAYQPPKWKSPPFLTLFPFQPIQATSPTKEPNVYCFCGAMSVKMLLRKPGSMQGSFFFVCGNWTANRGAVCPFIKWASSSASVPDSANTA
uniref:GRF-type domain-containing protein n=1 Tax=Opuntia streptacantha TaxID=393608 RepID=A0A7C9D0E9_OPUST